jgi:hypothetical protein
MDLIWTVISLLYGYNPAHNGNVDFSFLEIIYEVRHSDSNKNVDIKLNGHDPFLE